MKTYKGKTFGMVFVHEDDKRRQLEPRLDLRNHSPTGFAWGYSGSGPAQLSLALINDAFGGRSAENDRRTLAAYQRLKVLAVAPRNKDAPFEITQDEILRLVGVIEADKVAASLGGGI